MAGVESTQGSEAFAVGLPGPPSPHAAGGRAAVEPRQFAVIAFWPNQAALARSVPASAADAGARVAARSAAPAAGSRS